MNAKRNVYFIQRGVDGPIKIGATSGNPRARMKALQCGAPETLNLIGCLIGSEKELHEKFQAYRIAGEWFEPRGELLEFIRSSASESIEVHDNHDNVICFRVRAGAFKYIQKVRRRISKKAGVKVSTAAAVRAILESVL